MCAQSTHTLGPSKQRAWPLNSALCVNKMNPNYAVDLNFEENDGSIFVIRRRDNAHVVLGLDSEAKIIGQAAYEGLDTKALCSLNWSTKEKTPIETENTNTVVVWRDNGETLVSTPFYEWGPAPKIKLVKQPSYNDLGLAILKQVKYIKDQRHTTHNK